MRRLIVIDDSEAEIDFIERILCINNGYKIRRYTDPVAFLQGPDMYWAELVILDLAMPVLSGFGVLAEIRAHRPKLPVVVVTGANEFDDRVRSINMGATSVIMKPIDAGRLRSLVKDSLGDA